ncbi:MAG TPA: ABC transporter ATP-binding protein [Candidatus Limnocylindrales bacterium]|nr:ABC transporter ATP-binding protein [Candidatus Limnocylindrales bacterium]
MPSPSQGAVIAVSDLRKSYGPLRAVDGVSFTVERGEIFGLLGPNGAGKTTTVEILEGLRRPDGGQASVLGIDVVRDPGTLKERIGVQLQTAALYPELTVRELITLFGSFYRRSLPASRLIEQLGLEERAGAVSRELSGGQRQRLTIALALVNDPELIFLDEPTTGLDPQGRRSLWERIEALRDDGRTVLLTTHYMEEAEHLCDRVAVMDHGRILEMGTVRELVGRHFSQRTVRFEARPQLTDTALAGLRGVSRVSHENGEVVLLTGDVPRTIGGLLELGDSLGVQGLDIAVRRPTLEDVFLQLTGRALRD